MSKSHLASKLLGLLTAVCIITSACAPAQKPPDVSADDSPGILSVLFDTEPEMLSGFSYYGSAAYSRDWDGSLIPESGPDAEEFGCGTEGAGHGHEQELPHSKYSTSEEKATYTLAEGLEGFELDEGFREDITAETTVIGSEYMGFCLSVSGWYYPYVYVFENGDVYVDRGSDGAPPRRYKAKNAAQYGELKQAVENTREILDALPLDYQLSFSVSPQTFNPDSTAVRLRIENKGADNVEFFRTFVVEKEENGVWSPLAEINPASPDMQSVGPRGSINYSVDLTSLKGGQETGSYRLHNVFVSDGESAELTAEYEISADAPDASHPFPPEMIEENKLYYLRYLSTWGLYNPFKESYSDSGFTVDFQPYPLYLSCVYLEGKSHEYNEKYSSYIPSQIVDDMITRHFPVTAEEFRAKLPSKADNQAEYYDPDSDSYYFEGGYGGESSRGVVTNAIHDGNNLLLTCSWYAPDDRYEFTHTVTISLGSDSNDFFYKNNNVHTE